MYNVVKYKRKSEGFDLTQKELAEVIGVSSVTIYKIENGMGCNVETALKMAKFFNCKVEDLFKLEEELS